MISRLKCVMLMSVVPFLLANQGGCLHQKTPKVAKHDENANLACRIIGPLALHDLTDEEVDHLTEMTQDIIADQKVYFVRRCKS